VPRSELLVVEHDEAIGRTDGATVVVLMAQHA
jgi:hypothetical protein